MLHDIVPNQDEALSWNKALVESLCRSIAFTVILVRVTSCLVSWGYCTRNFLFWNSAVSHPHYSHCKGMIHAWLDCSKSFRLQAQQVIVGPSMHRQIESHTQILTGCKQCNQYTIDCSSDNVSTSHVTRSRQMAHP